MFITLWSHRQLLSDGPHAITINLISTGSSLKARRLGLQTKAARPSLSQSTMTSKPSFPSQTTDSITANLISISGGKSDSFQISRFGVEHVRRPSSRF